MIEVHITEPGGPDVLQLRYAEVPTPAVGQVLVRVAAAGVNRPDVMQRTGAYPMPPGVTPIPGLEIAGVVAAVGANVAGWSVGDEVFGLTDGGGYAEYCVVPAGQLLRKPPGMSMVQAAAIPEVFFTVWANVFHRHPMRRGQSMLVHGGTSGIGSAALALGREFGLRTFSTGSSDEKCSVARQLGADVAINARTEDFPTVIARETGGQGVDLIVDIVGADYIGRNIAALGRDGRLVLLGFMGGTVASEVDLLQIALKRAVLTGSTMRARTPSEKAAIAEDLRAKVMPVWTEGRCVPPVDTVFGFRQVADAHRLMESGTHVGKVVLRMD